MKLTEAQTPTGFSQYTYSTNNYASGSLAIAKGKKCRGNLKAAQRSSTLPGSHLVSSLIHLASSSINSASAGRVSTLRGVHAKQRVNLSGIGRR